MGILILFHSIFENDTSIIVFCNITNKVLKSNGKFLILPFMRDPSTCERERVPAGFFRFSILRCCRCVAISRCLPALFSAEKSSLLISSKIPVPLAPVIPTPVIFSGIIPFISVSVIVVPTSFVVVIVVTSSVSISITMLWSVLFVSLESFFFRVLTIAWFYVLNRRCLPLQQVVLASVCCVCT